MKFSKRVNFLLLSFLITLNVALRYPTVQHELGADSFVIHILGDSITRHHYAKWILHPLSYIGLYPFSYPSAYPFLAADVSVSTGLDVESSIFLISIALGLIGVFGTYFLAREIKKDDLFCFVAALTFTLSPVFVRTTFWQASTRNLFVALAPSCMLLLLKTRGFAINRLNILFVITLFTVGTSHRLGVFMIFILIAYLTGVIMFALYKQILPMTIKSKKLNRSFRIAGPLIITGIFVALLGMLISGNNPLQGAQGLVVYQETVFFTGRSIPILLLNLFVSLIGRIGFMILFAMIGFAYLIWKKNKGLYEVFIVVSLIFIFPTIGMRTYSSYFFLIFFSLLAGYSFLQIFKFLKRKKVTGLALAIMAAALIASVGFHSYMWSHWRVTDYTMTEPTYDCAIYVKYNTNNTYIANNGLKAARISAISGKSCLPIGGATLVDNGPEQLIYDYLHEEDYQIIPIAIDKITVGSDALYKAKGAGNVEQDWTTIHQTQCDDVSDQLIIKYRLQYSVVDKNWLTGYWAFARSYYSRFLTSSIEARYKIYDNGAYEVWYFDHP
ncbi:MAG: hypothetical protein JSW00_01210 [Thermoplasmata archaeon]|nr:MAG: hypothetical protein JSW00_01210 [Thermoplasmata archaeon]